jgi:Antitoxin Xre/MbcA/ParS C-terminal toxin-binding domain
MDRREPDPHRDVIPLHGRKPEDRLPLDQGDARSAESTLALEFAQRALSPVIRDLRDRHGLLDPRRVAPALGMTTAQLASCLEQSEELLMKAPRPPELEARLEPFAMVVGVVRDSYGGDDKRVRLWLRTGRPELDGRTPLEALCEPGGIQSVVKLVLSAWLGNAD